MLVNKHGVDSILKGASGAFFICSSAIRWFVILVCLGHVLPLYAACSTSNYDDSGIVQYVHDGDTLWLQDGRRIRLLGINAPELARDQFAAEPFAVAARDDLRQRLPPGTRINLVFDQTKRDHYQRWLAHVLVGQENIQVTMLKKGLVEVLILPPNTLWAECYKTYENHIRRQRRGIWGHRYYRFKPVEQWAQSRRQRQRIQGVVKTVVFVEGMIQLRVGSQMIIEMPTDLLSDFDSMSLQALQGKKIAARGWLRQYDDSWWLRINHPTDLYL